MKKSIIIAGVVSALAVIICVMVVLFYCVLYPVKYKSVIEKYAQVFNLDPVLICAVINTESGFKTDAVSAVGAKGLMQIMPSTAAEIAEKLGVSSFNEELLFVPEVNIRFGCYYLKYLLTMFNGNIVNSVAAYNAGFNKVAEWLKTTEYVSGESVVNPPIIETKNYVKKVSSAIKVYNFRY